MYLIVSCVSINRLDHLQVRQGVTADVVSSLIQEDERNDGSTGRYVASCRVKPVF